MKYTALILLAFLFFCNTNQKTYSPKNTTEKAEPLTDTKLSSETIDFFLASNQVDYYEIPELSEIIHPEELGTFSIQVKNQSHLDRFKHLVGSRERTYTHQAPKNCKPTFNSALVFHSKQTKEAILFSRNCALLYLYGKKLYSHVTEENMQIENTFRMIRSGR